MAPVTCGTWQDYMFSVTKMTVTCLRFARGIFRQLTSSMLLISFTDRRTIREVQEEHFKHSLIFWHVWLICVDNASQSFHQQEAVTTSSSPESVRRGGLTHGDDKYMTAYQHDVPQIQHASLLYNTLISLAVNPVRSHLSWTELELQGKKSWLHVSFHWNGWVSHRLMLDSSTI